MPTGQSDEGNPSVEVSSFQMTQVCVKLAKLSIHTLFSSPISLIYVPLFVDLSNGLSILFIFSKNDF